MRFLWVFLVCIVIALSLTPAAYLGRYVPNNDKLMHFAGYTALAFVPVASFRTRAHKIQALLFTVALGVILEFLQTRVPGRAFDFRDMEANTAGVLVGTLAALLTKALLSRRPS